MLHESSDAFRLARLASTGRLAVACALELRRLIALAGGSVSEVARSNLAAAQLRDLLGLASDITRRLLTAAQRPSTETTMVDLGDLVEEMRTLLGIIAGGEAIVVIVRDAARVRTLANRGDLEQLLVNLVETPCNADAAARRLTITSGFADWPGDATLAAGQYALLAVTDDDRTHSATEPRPCATCGALPALGLPLVRAIAAAHGGALVVVPGVDGGVAYRVLLPLAPT